MLFNITYPDPQTKHGIKECVGTAFSLLQRLRMGGNGSRRMRIIETSALIDDQYLNRVDARYGNIELRQAGVLIGFRTVQRIFVYAIAYEQVELSAARNYLRIGDVENYFLFEPLQNSGVDLTFVAKLRERMPPSNRRTSHSKK